MSGELNNTSPNRPKEESASPPDESAGSPGETTAPETVRCALTGEVISADEAYWAPPLVTVQELIKAVSANIKSPGNLGNVLFGEQENVPYSPDAREELAARRTTEQLKLLGFLLLILVVIGGIIYLLV